MARALEEEKALNCNFTTLASKCFEERRDDTNPMEGLP
jgi:hypothetical protein